MIQVKTIDESDALKIIKTDESHFFDHKGKYISGADLQTAVCTFANSDGGEIYVGIDDTADGITDLTKWNGFERQEFANNLINLSSQAIPTPPVSFEFLEINNKSDLGLALRITIEKSAELHKNAKNEIWVRKGAQKNLLTGDQIINLRLSKGLISFEDQLISNYDVGDLENSKNLVEFLNSYSPKTPPREFLYKQRLVRKDTSDIFHPTYSGILLFAENPVSDLPKKCSIKIARYDTSEIAPRREHLREQFTVEGPLYSQINKALEFIRQIVEKSPVLGESGLEKARYPTEAIKEILVNAVIHRDYNISDDVLVFIFNNRIEIKNPGLLPGHITKQNILTERFARNPTIVRLLNKYPDPPNKDIGEGLNTAFEKMTEVKLRPPTIEILPSAVLVTIPHQPLAAPEETVLEFLNKNPEITNTIGRKLTGIASENAMKGVFKKLQSKELIEKVPGKLGPNTAWRLAGNHIS